MSKDNEPIVLDDTPETIAALKAQMADMQAALQATEKARLLAEKQADTLAQSVATLESVARRKRFTDEILGHANDGTRWLGAADENVEYLEDIAMVYGEDSAQFQRIVAHHRAMANQFRAGEALTEKGSASSDNGDPQARLLLAASALMAQEPGLSLVQAKARVVEGNPEIRAALMQKGGK